MLIEGVKQMPVFSVNFYLVHSVNQTPCILEFYKICLSYVSALKPFLNFAPIFFAEKDTKVLVKCYIFTIN